MVYRLRCCLGTVLLKLSNLHHHQPGHLRLRHPMGPRQTYRLRHCLLGRRHSSKRLFQGITLEWYGSSIHGRDGFQQS